MARQTFFSFYFKEDAWRTSQVRNIGALGGNKSVSDNDWEEVKKGGDKAISNWIDSQLSGRSCAVILIGANTAGRKWINYEITKAWNDGKGVVGIHIHNLKDSNQNKSSKGSNPFSGFTVGADKKALTSVVKTYDPPKTDSKEVYDHISSNIERWIEEAISIRKNFVK